MPLMYYIWGTEADNNAIMFTGHPWQAVVCLSEPPVMSPLPPVLDRSSDLSAYNLPVTIEVDVGAAGSGTFELATLYTGCWVNLKSRSIGYSGPPDAWYPFLASEVIESFNNEDVVAQSMGIMAGGYGVSNGTGLAVGLSMYPTPADVSPYQVWPPTSTSASLGDDIKVGCFVVVKYGPSNLVVGAQRNGTLKIDQEVVDITSKDLDWWKDHYMGFRTWSLDCDGLLFPADPGQAALVTALLYAGDIPTAPVSIGFYVGSGLVATGTATIKSIEIGGPYQEAGTFKASFEGSGALTNPLTEGSGALTNPYYVWGTEADNNAIMFTGHPWQAVVCWSEPPVVSPFPPVLDRSSDLSAYNLPVTIAVDVGIAGLRAFELATLYTGCWVSLKSRSIGYSGPPDAWYPFLASEVIASFNSDGVAHSMGITAGGYGVSDGTGLAVGFLYLPPGDVSTYQVWPPTS